MCAGLVRESWKKVRRKGKLVSFTLFGESPLCSCFDCKESSTARMNVDFAEDFESTEVEGGGVEQQMEESLCNPLLVLLKILFEKGRR